MRPLDCPGGRNHPGFKLKLKYVFQCELYKPRVSSLTNMSVGRAVVAIPGVTTRVQELGVIKCVKEFRAKLQVGSLGD